MRLNRVYVDAPLTSGENAVVTGDAANHIARVLRMRVGEPLTLFNGSGGEYAVKIAEFQGAKVLVRVGEHSAIERESPLHLTLLQGIARGDRMDTIVQKATELGISRIVPVITERSVVKLAPHTAHRKHAHWRAIAIAACEQCGRNRVPEVAQPHSLFEACGMMGSENGISADGISADGVSPVTRRFLLAPEGETTLAESAARGSGPIALLIGPEGGLAVNEIDTALRAGFIPCRLGPRILRTETASLVALATLQAIAGDLQG